MQEAIQGQQQRASASKGVAMTQDMQGLADEAPERAVLDVATIPDGSGNDRDADEVDAERFDAG